MASSPTTPRVERVMAWILVCAIACLLALAALAMLGQGLTLDSGAAVVVFSAFVVVAVTLAILVVVLLILASGRLLHRSRSTSKTRRRNGRSS